MMAVVDGKGYLRINLWLNGKARHFYVHRMVGLAFIDIVPNKPRINHKLGVKLANHYTQLEWCTDAENNEHGFQMGLLKRGNKKPPKPYVSVRNEWSFHYPVIDLNTGVFYNSTELANLLGETKSYMIRMLSGDRKNKYSRYQYA